MKKVTIIIPVCNGLKYLTLTINNILKTVRYPNYEILIVESGSTDGTHEYVEDLVKKHDNIKALFTEKEGITKAINKGIKSVKEGDVFLTQNDVLFPDLMRRCWLTELEGYSNIEEVGLITSLNGGGVVAEDGLTIPGFQWVGTWCMYIPRRIIEKIGLFDEGYSPGPCDDMDYTYRVIQSGLKIYCASFAVDHHRLAEHYNEDDALNIKAAKYFIKKFNIIKKPSFNICKDSWNVYSFCVEFPEDKNKVYEKHDEIQDFDKIKDKTVLDYGCGQGYDAIQYLKNGNKVYLADIISNFLRVAKRNIKKMDLEKNASFILLPHSAYLPFNFNFFDVINLDGVLHHIPDPKIVVDELYRILKPDGKIYCMLYTEKLYKQSLKTDNLDEIDTKKFGWTEDKCIYARPYNLEQVKKLFNKFNVLESHEYYDGKFCTYILEKKKRVWEFEGEKINLQEDAFDNSSLFDNEGNFSNHPLTYKKGLEILKTFTDKDIFLDIGAHYGTFSLLLNKGKCYAFEPYDKNFKKLIKNTLLNPSKHIIPIKVALSDIKKGYHLESHPKYDGITKVVFDDSQVKTLPLDDIVINFVKFGKNEVVKLIKIDVEGLEYNVLKGAEKTIKTFHPYLIIECHRIETPKMVISFVKRLGYTYEFLDGNNILCKYEGGEKNAK
jgi:FkbM family methyltransferase